MYPVQVVDEKIKQIKQGDRPAREEFLENHKPFVYKMACKFAGRVLEWGRDEELAVALVALNEAIDRFREETGVPFLAYARIVMLSRLKDLKRRESRKTAAQVQLFSSIDESDTVSLDRSWEKYQAEVAAWEREQEIKEFEGLLNQYNVSFRDLVKCSPRHRKTRQSLMKVAAVIAENERLLQELHDNNKLPLAELERITGISRKTMERGRKYIIAITLLIHKQSDYIYLSSYLDLPVKARGDL